MPRHTLAACHDAAQLTARLGYRATVCSPQVPRITRVGDSFSCGATVTATDPTFSRNVTVSVSEQGLTRTSLATKTVAVTESRPVHHTIYYSLAKL